MTREERLVAELYALAVNLDDSLGQRDVCALIRRAAARIEELRRQIDFLESEGDES